MDRELETLRRCDEAGVRVLSLHPMFGPAKNPYQPLTVVHAVRDDALEERRLLDAVLSHPYLDWVPLPFDHHDRLMGWLLGLSHLTGLLFAGAGRPAPCRPSVAFSGRS